MSADKQKCVLRIDKSPMNPYRWVLSLECGHDVWVTAKRRPNRRKAECQFCAGKGDK